MRARRIGGKPTGIRQENSDHFEERGAQPACDHERVATVVARSREHDDPTAALREHAHSLLRRCGACTFHEPFVGMSRFDRAQFRNACNRRKREKVSFGRGGS